jgi:hypothetical protein
MCNEVNVYIGLRPTQKPFTERECWAGRTLAMEKRYNRQKIPRTAEVE